MFAWIFGAPLHKRSNRRRRRIQDRNLVALDDLPEAVLVRMIRGAFVKNARRTVAERPVHDVRVAGDPADVRGAPVNVVILDVENVLVRRRGARQITAGCMLDTFGFRGRAAGVQDEEQVFRVDRLGLARRGLSFDKLVPPDIAPGLHVHGVARPLDDDATLDVRHPLHGSVAVLLERHRLTAPPSKIGRDERDAAGVGDAIDDRIRRESSEDDRVRGPDPRASQHGNGQLYDHWKVDCNAVAALDSLRT